MRKSKKLLSLLVSVLLMLSCLCAVPIASAANPYANVYVIGQGAPIYTAEGKVIYNNATVVKPDGYIDNMFSDCLPLFVKAVTLGQWEEYKTVFFGYWNPMYEELKLDCNGEASNGSHFAGNTNVNKRKPDYMLNSYPFYSDWRLDPLYNATLLHDYIEAVKLKTGMDKVNLIGRCEGCNIVLAYLAQYGYDSVNVLEMYVSCANGIDGVGALFSGDLYLDAKVLRRYYDENVTLEDEELSEFLDVTFNYLVDSYGFEGAIKLLDAFVPKLYKEIIYEALLNSYATMPGVWSMVGSDYYEKAKTNIFAGVEEEYAGLIQKIDNYDRLVRQKVDVLLKEAEQNGVKVGVFAKYGDFSYVFPICKEVTQYSDNAICIQNSSFGATAAPLGEELSEEYIATHDAKYIAPDRIVDASTCLFPDTTWFAYNSPHNQFEAQNNVLMKKFIDSNGEMTVFTDENYPQFMSYINGVLQPMPEKEVTPAEEETPRFIRVFKEFFAFVKAMFIYLRTLGKQ